MQLTPGGTISGVGHAAVVLWLIAGWGLNSDPLEFSFMDVNVVSSEEYEAMMGAQAPEPAENAVPIAQPDPVEQPPEPVEPVAPEPETPAEPEPEPPAPEPAPEPPPPPPEPEPAPEPDLPPEPPAPQEPDAVPDAPDLPVVPQIVEDETLPESPRPVPRPSERVADDVAPPPPEDVAPGEEEVAAAEPDVAEPAEVVEEEQEAQAPEEAASQIVTEADTPASSAPEVSLRPRARPQRPVEVAEDDPEPAPETPGETTEASSDAVDAAVEAALAGAEETTPAPAASGPPLTGSEQEGFRIAVQDCWNVDAGSQAARITVTVGFSLTREGRVDGSVRRISVSDGPEAAQDSAFEAARRAVLRCQTNGGRAGYDLPADKYDRWRNVELTFDPARR